MACRKISHFVRGFPIQSCLIAYTITSQLDRVFQLCKQLACIAVLFGFGASSWDGSHARQRERERERERGKQINTWCLRELVGLNMMEILTCFVHVFGHTSVNIPYRDLQKIAQNISWALACGMFKGAFPMPAREVVARRVSRSEIGKAWCLKTSYKRCSRWSNLSLQRSRELKWLVLHRPVPPVPQWLSGGWWIPEVGRPRGSSIGCSACGWQPLWSLRLRWRMFFRLVFWSWSCWSVWMGSPPSKGSSQTRWGCETFTTLLYHFITTVFNASS